jgi:hypothetical protein
MLIHLFLFRFFIGAQAAARIVLGAAGYGPEKLSKQDGIQIGNLSIPLKVRMFELIYTWICVYM